MANALGSDYMDLSEIEQTVFKIEIEFSPFKKIAKIYF
jgi:hypothetical protein